MRIGFLMYNTSPLFEIITAKYLLQTKHDTYLVGEKDKIISAEKINVDIDLRISEDLTECIDALVIAGGDIENIENISLINLIIKKLNNEKKVIASICAGNKILLDALEVACDREITGIKTIEKNIVCASADASVNFGIYLGSLFDIYKDSDDFYETVQFFG